MSTPYQAPKLTAIEGDMFIFGDRLDLLLPKELRGTGPRVPLGLTPRQVWNDHLVPAIMVAREEGVT